MSTLQQHKARVTSAVGSLSKTLSTIDMNVMPIDSTTAPDIQFRMLLSRHQTISSAKDTIEEAVETLKSRYQSLLCFALTMEDREEIDDNIDQFWKEQQGDHLLDKAKNIIATLDTQLTMDKSIQASLQSQLNENVTARTATLSIADSIHPNNISLLDKTQDSPQYLTPANSPQETLFSVTQPLQLPPIELPTFDGNALQFHDFWCRYKTVVHDNNVLSPSLKLVYLSDLLQESAALMIQGYDFSQPDNYHHVIQALRKRYDRPQFAHNLFHRKLAQLPASSSSASVQRDTLCQIHAFILQLSRYEDTTTSSALMNTIRSKFPRETQLEVNRIEHRSGRKWTLPELLDGLNEFIEELEKLDDYAIFQSTSESHANPVSTVRSRSPSPELRYDPNMCCFCRSTSHRSTRCYHYLSTTNRRLIVNTLHLCWKCFRPGHLSRNCNRLNCARCNGYHHHLICTHSDRRRSKESQKGRRRRGREHHHSHSKCSSRSRTRSPSYERSLFRSSSRPCSRSPRPPRSRSPSPRRSRMDASKHSRCHRLRSPACDIDSFRRSLAPTKRTRSQDNSLSIIAKSVDQHDEQLSDTHVYTVMYTSTPYIPMTVQASAIDYGTETSVPVILLLDASVQRSFITHAAVSKLHLTPLTTVTAEATRTATEPDTVDLILVDHYEKKMQLTLHMKNEIITPYSPVDLTPKDKQFLQSHSIDIDQLTTSRTVVPDILIGTDHLWDIIVMDYPQTLPSGLFLCNTRFGPTISGYQLFRGSPSTTQH